MSVATYAPRGLRPLRARSGDDYVTMENVAQGSSKEVALASDAWFYRMYGKAKFRDDQSYCGQLAAEASIGDRTELLGLTNRPVPRR